MTSPANKQEAGVAGHTPGPWFVRTQVRLGELRDCFVAAPDCQGLAYDAEILGDDEYREDDGIKRKLADCHLIAAALPMKAALELIASDDTERLDTPATMDDMRAIARAVLAAITSATATEVAP